MIDAAGSSSGKSEGKKYIINQLTYVNVIKKDLKI